MGRKATITDRDMEMIDFITSYAVDKGYLPTLDEIAEGCYMCRSNVWYRMHKLEEKGLIIRNGYQWGVKGLKYVRG